VSGFPKRKLFAYSLVQPIEYSLLQAKDPSNLQLQLTPERHPDVVNTWINFDPRVEWFMTQLNSLKSEKVLTICANDSTALQLSEALRVKAGTRSTVFHEGMGIVERDRAANYFAQSEDGAQVLICSEIGSEGRNFQFARHLVLFDLPDNCDLIEQRIGRLDRIGQKFDIQLHIPYFENHSSERLFELLNQGVDVFSHPNPLAQSILNHHHSEMTAALESSNISDLHKLIDALIPEREIQQQALEQHKLKKKMNLQLYLQQQVIKKLMLLKKLEL
jgi:ATP-dependent helicase HepA